MSRGRVVILLCTIHLVWFATATKLDVQIERSSEGYTYLTEFAFTSKGHMFVNVSHLKLFAAEQSSVPNTTLMGFFRVNRSNFSRSHIEGIDPSENCLLHSSAVSRMFVISDVGAIQSNGERPFFAYHEDIRESGDFLFYFANCVPSVLVSGTVSFDLYNESPRGKKLYLPAGQAAYPYICFLMGLGYWVLTAYWLWQARKSWFQTVTPQTHHFSLTCLLIVNIVLQFAIGIRYLVVQLTGSGYFVDFVVIGISLVQTALILVTFYSGLPKVEPYMSEFEQNCLLVAVPSLVVSYFLTFVISNFTAGTAWDDFLNLLTLLVFFLEIVCWGILLVLLCLTVLSWLCSSALASNKRQQRRQEEFETPFERFYVVCLSYLMAAALAIKLLEWFLPFYLEWIHHLFGVLSIFLLYVFIVYKLRPKSEMSVYQLFDESDNLDEELEDF